MNAAAKNYDGVNKYIRITDIDEASSTYTDKDIVSPDGVLTDNYLVNNRDILLARTGASTGKSYLYKKSDGKLYYAGFLIRANVTTHDPYFVFSQLHTHRYWRWVSIMSARSGQPGINSQEYSSFPIYTTSIEEESKIAKLLSLLDERIATQNKIIDKLQSLIKGICNNYFEKLSVQEKANLIRLSDVLKERNEYSSKDGKFIHGTLSKDGIFPKTGRWDRDFLVKQEDKKYKVSHLDDICYNPANLKFGVICRNTFGDLIFSPIYVTFEVCKNVNIGFMELYLTNHNFIEKVRRFEQGTVYERMAVSPEDFLSYKIRIPSYSDQTFFYKKVQWLITLSQNEMKLLSQYKKLRQYLLRQMFI